MAVIRINQMNEPCILLNLRDTPRYWELPGGMPEPCDGYNPYETALRETCEEVGIPVPVLRSFIPIEILIPSEKYLGQFYLILLIIVPRDFTVDHYFTNQESRGNCFFPISILTTCSSPNGGYDFVKFQREYFLPHILDYIQHATPRS